VRRRVDIVLDAEFGRVDVSRVPVVILLPVATSTTSMTAPGTVPSSFFRVLPVVMLALGLAIGIIGIAMLCLARAELIVEARSTVLYLL